MRDEMTSIWGHGQLLAYSGLDGPTSFEDGLCLRSIGPGTVLRVVLPGTADLVLDAAHPPSSCELGGDHFRIVTAAGTVRGALLDACHLLVEGPLTVIGADARIAVLREGERTLIAPAHRLRPARIQVALDPVIAARRRWADATCVRLGLQRRPAAIKALRQLKTQIYSPEGIFRRRWSTPDRWPHRGCWLWDSAFHAIGARHVEAVLARDLVEAVLDGQRPDGRVAIRMDPDGSCHHEYTQPPTLVLATWCIDQASPDPAWLRHLLPRLEAYLDWDLRERDGGHGLPCWRIEGKINCRSGESGLDNSSRFDAATQMEAVDFSAFLSLEYGLLAELWQRLGEPAASARCQARKLRLDALIRERLWDGASGLFRDHDLDRGGFCPVAACTGFLPLTCGAASPAQAAELARSLEDPRRFGTRILLPSVARDDASYDTDMWRGPVWVNMVWLVAAGFARYGYTEHASNLRNSIVAEIERWHASRGTLFEFFDADGAIPPDQLKRKGSLAPEVSYYNQCFHDYGWTGTLYLDLILAREEPLPPLVRA